VLTKAGGGTVTVLPRGARVDLVELDGTPDLIAAATVEAGIYTRATFQLDFTAADVVVVGQATPASVRDPAGNAVTGAVPVVLDFPSGSRLVVRPGRDNLLVLDLDLAQSLTVDAQGNVVTLAPVWSAAIDPPDRRAVAVTGVLHRIDPAASTFVVERRAPDQSVIAEVPARVDAETVFQLDGVAHQGAPGLGMLQAHLTEHVLVHGILDTEDLVLAATSVEAGAGTPGGGQDTVVGHVVARSGGTGSDATLTVLGTSFDVATGTRRLETLHTVTTTLADTKVLRRGSADAFDGDALAVGQRVQVFGVLDATAMNARDERGVVRVLPTSLAGVAAGAVEAGTVTLDLARLGGRDAGGFDFVVGGTVQADPDAFRVDVADLEAGSLAAGSRVRARAWIAAVDDPGADAKALAVLDAAAGGHLLVCQWTPRAAGVLAESGDGFALDVASASTRVVTDGFEPVTLAASPRPRLLPAESGGFYNVAAGGIHELHASWAGFRQAVLEHVDSSRVFRVTALGTFDAGTQEFTARAVTVAFD
jgi:hypothetical protein